MNKSLRTLLGTLAICVLGVVVMVGCAGTGGSLGSSGSGTLRVHMSDGSDPTIQRVDIHVTQISANINGQWQTVSSDVQDFNLLDLVQNSALIGSNVLPAGNYTQIRLLVESATVTDSTGTHPLVIPSGSQTGIKVNVNFEVLPNDITDILLDFNVSRSIIRQGNGTYRLQPVIPAVVMVRSGTAVGVVSNASGVVQGATVTATYTAGTAYPLGAVVNTTSTMADGSFKVWALLPGTYTFTVTYLNPATNLQETATVSGIVVNANESTNLGPITIQ